MISDKNVLKQANKYRAVIIVYHVKLKNYIFVYIFTV